MERKTFEHDGLKLSYLDAGGNGEPLIALHALWMEAGTFERLARQLAPEWRIVALDQRGHGESDHARDYSWDAYVRDVAAFLQHLKIDRAVVFIGNSLGGMVAFKFAARFPKGVRALVMEEAPARAAGDFSFMLAWKGVFPSRQALLDKVGERLAWSVEPSIRQVAGGWKLAFSPEDIVAAQAGLNGEFWEEWCASKCPALVLQGLQSRAVDGAILRRMAEVRPDTRFQSFDAGHVIHHDAPDLFAAAVRSFLAALPRSRDETGRP